MAIAVRAGDKCKVWVETPDGRVIEFSAVSTRIDMHMPYSGLVETHIEFDTFDSIAWKEKDAFRRQLKEEKSASEWKCDYCGRPNKAHDETCKSCGAVWSFIYA